jgi:hypothetical protein
MPYFIRLVSPQHPHEAWFIDDEIAYDVFNRGGVLPGDFNAEPGKTALDVMRERTPAWFEQGDPFIRLRLDQGHYHRRIARPLLNAREDAHLLFCPSLHLEQAAVASSRGQALSLLRLLQSICQTVQPGPKTFAAYGHDIRNLVILACTEVETHWRGVLVANGAQRKSFTTADYVKLVDIMGLRDFLVSFPAFPDLEPIRPFEGWGQGQHPTTDLSWYADYNAVKHNREEEFERANLLSAFQALSAVAVMLVAQFGPYGLGHRSELSSFFILRETPSWPLSETYLRDGALSTSIQVHTQFAPVNHPVLAKLKDKPKAQKKT